MPKQATVQEALKKACIYEKKPKIPPKVATEFKPWTHCEIRAYHQRIRCKKANGKPKRTRRVRGFLFIFLMHSSGDITGKPIRIIHKEGLTRREFVCYARKLTDNTNQSLLHVLAKK
jgi:hypothetical protein